MKKIILILLAFSCSAKKENVNPSLVTITFDKKVIDQVKLDIQNSFSKSENDIIFLGDSKTEGFPTQEMFNNLNIKNRGIAGNTTAEVLQRLSFVTSGHPKKIFLEIGLNDFTKNVDVKTAFSNFSQICNQIKRETPKTKLIIESVLPTTLENKGLNSKINDYNKLLQNYCLKNELTFIDINPTFLEGVEMNKKYTYDGIHLNAEGYDKWKEVLNDYIK